MTPSSTRPTPRAFLCSILTIVLMAGLGLSTANLVEQASAQGTGNLKYYPLLNPVRLLDTRVSPFQSPDVCTPRGTPLEGGSYMIFSLGSCGGSTSIPLPSRVYGIEATLTVVNPDRTGFASLLPGGSITLSPKTASLTYAAGDTVSSHVTVTDGTFGLYSSATADYVLDVTGVYSRDEYYSGAASYYQTGSYYFPLANPVRMVDTRGLGAVTTLHGRISGDTTILLPGFFGSAVVGRITVVNPENTGHLTTYPMNGIGGVPNVSRPLAADLTYRQGQVVGNEFVARLGYDATSQQYGFRVATTSPTDVVIDIMGYYWFHPQSASRPEKGTLFNPLKYAPNVRLVDTRAGMSYHWNRLCNVPGVPVSAQSPVTFPDSGCLGVPAEAVALSGTISTVNPATLGFLKVLSSIADLGNTVHANLNFNGGQLISGGAHFPIDHPNGPGLDGTVNVFSTSRTDVIIDVSGYYAPVTP